MHWNFQQTYTQLPEAFFSRIMPEKVPAPAAAILNYGLADELDLDPARLSSEEGVAELAGCQIPQGADPIAQAYAGHQFGAFTMLGDGRAIVLGEHVDTATRRWDVQYKGSGRTPYSRSGDGKAAIGPMLREYIISEAMHALNIPTTRSLAVVTTGEAVYREAPLPGAVLTRIASSHIRVGTFQYAAAQRDTTLLQSLADYTIRRHFPALQDAATPYLDFMEAVMLRQIALISAWMHVGFIHGVMNTDNMALSGETIDYGPCAFMDAYDPATVFSSIDRYGRYAFAHQPPIALWNLSRFAETLLPLIHPERAKAIEKAEEVLARFETLFAEQWNQALRQKLGLGNKEEGDTALVAQLLQWMHQNRADYINTFRMLMDARETPGKCFGQDAALLAWWNAWVERRKRQPQSDEDSLAMMQRATPAVIPRNHRVEEALQAASEAQDYKPLHALLEALQDPFNHQHLRPYYQTPPPADAPPYRTFCGT